MADVWFAKESGSASTSGPSTAAPGPALSDLLAAPAGDVLPGHATDISTTTHAAAAVTHVHIASELHGFDRRSMADEENGRGMPLL
jgi:hypothetical protein